MTCIFFQFFIALPQTSSVFVQEAVVQYEQYEQEVRDLQGLIEEAHRVIQDRPIPASNIQELQAQILHHEVQTPRQDPDPRRCSAWNPSGPGSQLTRPHGCSVMPHVVFV